MAKQQLDEGVLAIIRETARETAEEVIRQHKESCPVSDLKNDVYGQGEDGIKMTVASHGQRLNVLEGRGTWFSGVLSSIVSSAIISIAGALIFMYVKSQK